MTDYDRTEIPAAYDRGRDHGPEMLALWMDAIAAHHLISQTIAPDWDIYADKIAANADSVLARLTREDFADGLAALRQYAVVEQPDAVVEPIDLFVFRA